MTVYSFDANSFITPWRYNYRPRFFPDFWEGLNELVALGSLKCAEPVYEELERGDDDLFDWVRHRRDNLVYPWDTAVQQSVLQVQRECPNIVDPDGNSGGDPWVVAVAIATGGQVITYERRKGPGANRPAIPNVCERLGVPCSDIYGLFERENWVFRRMR